MMQELADTRSKEGRTISSWLHRSSTKASTCRSGFHVTAMMLLCGNTPALAPLVTGSEIAVPSSIIAPIPSDNA
jgi:hypothetical protein